LKSKDGAIDRNSFPSKKDKAKQALRVWSMFPVD